MIHLTTCVDGLISGTTTLRDLHLLLIIKLVKHTSMLLTETADQTFLLQYVKDYCEALAENYRIYHKRPYREIYLETIQNMHGNSYKQWKMVLLTQCVFACRKVRSITKSFKKSTAMHQVTTVPKQVTRPSVHSFVGKESLS